MADNYVYVLDGKAYVNLTNRCRNACAFCIRNSGDGVAGTPLWLDNEPNADDVMSAFDKVTGVVKDEIVFCGYGEPTERLDVLTECAARFKARGYKLRLNTNGLGSASNGHDISSELCAFDTVSVSLNNFDARSYYDITRSQYGLDAFDCVVNFALACKTAGINTVFTVVDTIGEENINKCRALCDGLGIPLRVRKYVADNYNG